MKQTSELIFDTSVRYSETHTWAKTVDELIEVGISDYAQNQLGEIIYIDLPEVGCAFKRSEEFGVVESTKVASELFMPVGGVVVEVNDVLRDTPDMLNADPFSTGWMVKILPEDVSELEKLLTVEAYRDTLK